MEVLVHAVDPLLRRRIVAGLETVAGMGPVRSNPAEATLRAMAAHHGPQVVVMDLCGGHAQASPPDEGREPRRDLAGGAGRRPCTCDGADPPLRATSLSLLRQLKEDDAGRPVVALMASERAERVLDAIRAGADATAASGGPIGAIVREVVSVASGRSVVRNEIAQLLSLALRAEQSWIARDLRMLTDRERAVLGQLALGRSDRLTSRDLRIDATAVAGHVERLLRRLSFRSRVEAAVWAADQAVHRRAGNEAR